MKPALGKGLGALISSADEEERGIRELKINEIEPNTEQPRRSFDDEKLRQLADSIKQHGVVQPIIVRRDADTYRIVAGERRWRAARMAGLNSVPVIIKDVSDRQVMEIALIENLQREDLNPLEEAEAYEKLIKEYDLTQEEVSKAVGKSRSAIANSIRLLNLSDPVKRLVISGDLSSGHARALMGIEDAVLQEKAAKEVVERNLSVRETELLVKKYLFQKVAAKVKKKNEQLVEIEEKLKGIFGTKVQLLANRKKGKIMIEYYSNDELERLLELFDKLC